MKVIFLHIPKTAGQSIHAALAEAFGEESVCPARVNQQLKNYSIQELNQYSVFSGHFDWSMLDCVQGNKYTFTVLRKPIDRILSFYFYLHDKAGALPLIELNKPENQGMKAILELSVDDYFNAGPAHLRKFLDNHYDNFYTYYFAGRKYDARQDLFGMKSRGLLSEERLLDIAQQNMRSIDRVFSLDETSNVFKKINDLSGSAGCVDDYRVNVNKSVAQSSRYERLEKLGATNKAFDAIHGFCSMDNVLWEEFFPDDGER